MKKNSFKKMAMRLVFILVLVTFSPVRAAEMVAIEPVETANLTFFESRLTEPAVDNAYFYADNLYYQGGYGMPNCTAYAWGRAYEILGVKSNLPMGNANDWWAKNMEDHSYDYGLVPKLGAIICWAAGSSGHVAVVEGIQGDQVTYSESAWSGPIFTVDRYTVGMEETVSVGGFQGYIYIGDFIDAAMDTKPPEVEDLTIGEIDEEGFTITAKVTDEGTGIDQVRFPVWTDKGGQDDLIWHEGQVDQGIASCRVTYKEHHDEKGDYIVHVYAYDRAGLKTKKSLHKTAIIDYQSSRIAVRMINNQKASFNDR